MVRCLLGLLVFVSVLVGFAGGSADDPAPPLRIAISPWPGYP